VKAKMDDLATDQAALRGSIAKAEKVSSMVHMFLMIAKENEKYKGYSKAKKRFVMAVKRVMQINGVEKMKKYLDSFNGNKTSPVTKPSSRRSIIQLRGKAEV
jgi:predicted YcjX-like family ATPase